MWWVVSVSHEMESVIGGAAPQHAVQYCTEAKRPHISRGQISHKYAAVICAL